jgi:hypothetical protein
MDEHNTENQSTENSGMQQQPSSKSTIQDGEFIPCPLKESYSGLDMIKHLDQLFFEKFAIQESQETNQRKEEGHE